MSMLVNEFGNPWRVFDELLGDFPYEAFDRAWRARGGPFPRVNVWENEEGLVIEAEVAGVDPSKLDVAADGNRLTIKGEKDRGGGGKPAVFQRGFTLPFELSSDQIKASVKNGLLTVSIPRRAAGKRKIEIEAL